MGQIYQIYQKAIETNMMKITYKKKQKIPVEETKEKVGSTHGKRRRFK